jgi:hypothetical protein
MSILSICQSIQESSIGMQLRESTYLWPGIEALHVLCLALSVGTITLVDLRLMGFLMRDESVTDIIEQTRPLTIAGFVTAFVTGALLFWSEAGKLYPSYSFRIKLACIVLPGLNALLSFHRLQERRRMESISARSFSRKNGRLVWPDIPGGRHLHGPLDRVQLEVGLWEWPAHEPALGLR